MKIAIDSGNTLTKVGFFDSGELKKTEIVNNKSFNIESISGLQEAQSIILSSVSSLDFTFLKEKTQRLINLSTHTPIPLKISYKTPETLGADRIAAAVGATFLSPRCPLLIINAGTCITLDVINETGNHVGGSISPGINLRFRALNSFTSRLPLLETHEPGPIIGTTTEECITSGVLNGLIEEISGMIKRININLPGIKIYLTGGDAGFFETNLKASIFAVPELVLVGLNRILEYNVSET